MIIKWKARGNQIEWKVQPISISWSKASASCSRVARCLFSGKQANSAHPILSLFLLTSWIGADTRNWSTKPTSKGLSASWARNFKHSVLSFGKSFQARKPIREESKSVNPVNRFQSLFCLTRSSPDSCSYASSCSSAFLESFFRKLSQEIVGSRVDRHHFIDFSITNILSPCCLLIYDQPWTHHWTRKKGAESTHQQVNSIPFLLRPHRTTALDPIQQPGRQSQRTYLPSWPWPPLGQMGTPSSPQCSHRTSPAGDPEWWKSRIDGRTLLKLSVPWCVLDWAKFSLRQ